MVWLDHETLCGGLVDDWAAVVVSTSFSRFLDGLFRLFIQTLGGYDTTLATSTQSHEHICYSHSQSKLSIVHPLKLFGIINIVSQSYS